VRDISTTQLASDIALPPEKREESWPRLYIDKRYDALVNVYETQQKELSKANHDCQTLQGDVSNLQNANARLQEEKGLETQASQPHPGDKIMDTVLQTNDELV
jgi:hypothetical protein